MQPPLLVVHLIGAGIAAILVIAAVLSALLRRTRQYRPLALGLLGVTALQLTSGALLAYVSSTTVLAFCARVAVYLAVLGAAELVLLAAARRDARVQFAASTQVTR